MPSGVPPRREAMTHTILVIEDQADERDAMAHLLRRHHYLVEVAANGQDAIDRLGPGAALPDLLLLDLNMPVMDGWEFLYHIAQDRSLRRVPIVVIAGVSVPRHAMVVPQDLAFVVKPVEPHALLARIAEMLQSAASRSRAPITSEIAAAVVPPGIDVDIAASLEPPPVPGGGAEDGSPSMITSS